MFVRVVAPHFVAGAEFDDAGRHVRSAPILRRTAAAGVLALVTRAMAAGWHVELDCGPGDRASW